MEYRIRSAPAAEGVMLFRAFSGDRCLTHREVHQLWQTDEEFTRLYSEAILEPGFEGFCWETPAVTTGTLDAGHEFVIVKSDIHKSLSQDPGAFREHFVPGKLAVAFPNLGRNGIMITPTPDDSFDGASIAAFLSTASPERIVALWSLVGSEAASRVNDQPTWISTAGLGVSWLHVRLDQRPKYYRYGPYKQMA